MLEKIGLPAKPSLRGSNWVVDASHCQGCSSQFTFINRKHHCRRCGGIFCNSCTQSRMVLRGQGDSPVRICEPCKKLEEAARFEMRNRHKSRAAKGSSKLASKPEDELLEEILGVVQREASSSKLASDCDTVKTTGSSSCSTVEVASAHDAREVNRVQSDDERDNLHNETASVTPEELRSKASNEKKKYKVLKGEGKSEEALRAFKRGKELERQAEILEKISLRRNRKKDSQSVRDVIEENASTHRISHKEGKQNDDFTAELKDLGWSDMDSRDDEKRQPGMSLEGELASLLGQNTKKSSSHVTNKSQVVALKKKALMLKREGKLAEAKEELRRAKILEKQLEEQELIAEADDSDDELSAIIRDMDDDRDDSMLPLYEHSKALDLDDPLGTSDLIGVDGNFEVTEDDMEDPEIAAALTSLGWTEDPDHAGKALHCSVVNKDTVMGEILSLKKEALNQKRAGNTSKAVEQLKKAKLLERSLDNIDSQSEYSSLQHSDAIQNNISPQSDDKLLEALKVGDGYAGAGKDLDVKHANNSRLMIQKELLSVKRKALALRRDGLYEEAEEELRKAKTLEHQLEQTEKASNVKSKQENPKNDGDDLTHGIHSMSEDSEVPGVDVTDEDLNDPTYLSVLRNLGWKEDGTGTPSISVPQPKERDSANSSEASLSQAHSKISAKARTRSKAEIQRELLGLKRKALALRRQGHTDEAEEVLEAAKSLEAELAEMEAPKKLVESSSTNKKDVERRQEASQVEGDHVDVSEKDMSDPMLLSVLKDIGWKDEAAEPMAVTKIPSKDLNFSPSDFVGESFNQPSFNHLIAAPKSKREIQKELLGLKRKALALRRNGQTEEADDMLKQAAVLEAQMAELEVQKVEPSLHVPKEDRSGSHGGFTEVEKHRNTSMESVATSVGESNPGIESLSGSVKMRAENDLDMLIGKAPPSTEGNKLLSEKEGRSGEMGLLAGVRRVESTSTAYSSGNSTKTGDLLAGSDRTSSQADKSEAKERLDSDSSSHTGKTHKGIKKESIEVTQSGQKFHGHEYDTNLEYVPQKSQDSLKEEVLSHKRKAVALKREGRTAEALEELRQAKLLERTLTSDASPPEASPIDGQVNVLKDKTSVSPPKPLAGRERFKLQQESLAHKRQALKLRKEGRAQEAEAEFELAKALEAQLEESSSSGPSGYGAIVEDLLDPQLLSALKSIGLDDASLSSHSPEKPEPVKASSVKVENANAERIQLEEQIKAEKVKAVNFKRSGKQKDALDALRRAKLYEKKLNSMVSS